MNTHQKFYKVCAAASISKSSQKAKPDDAVIEQSHDRFFGFLRFRPFPNVPQASDDVILEVVHLRRHRLPFRFS